MHVFQISNNSSFLPTDSAATILNGSSTYADWLHFYRRVNGVLYLRIVFTIKQDGANNSVNRILGELPEGFRPLESFQHERATNIDGDITDFNDVKTAVFSVSVSGAIMFNQYTHLNRQYTKTIVYPLI